MQVEANRMLSLIVLALPLTSKLLDFTVDQYSSAHWDTTNAISLTVTLKTIRSQLRFSDEASSESLCDINKCYVLMQAVVVGVLKNTVHY